MEVVQTYIYQTAPLRELIQFLWPLCSCTDAAIQLKDTTTDNPLNSKDHSGKTQSPSKTASSTQNAHYTSSSTLPSSSSSILKTMDKDAGSARFVGSATTSAGGMAILLTKN